LRYDTAEISLIGDRSENQDRVAVVRRRNGVFLVVVDGMGGHADGRRAAEVATDSLAETFANAPKTIEDPADFLTRAVLRAHEAVVEIGDGLLLEEKPRATCAACLVVEDHAWWAHVGDARVYLLRGGEVLQRTRDHSHVEVLLRDGVITEDEIPGHPMRHYVESCLGGESAMPELGETSVTVLEPGDVLLACSDGLWSGVPDEEIAASVAGSPGLDQWLGQLSDRAVSVNAPYSDNTTAAAVRMIDG
jgi:serine/threonine protein phosphatase PrpC